MSELKACCEVCVRHEDRIDGMFAGVYYTCNNPNCENYTYRKEDKLQAKLTFLRTNLKEVEKEIEIEKLYGKLPYSMILGMNKCLDILRTHHLIEEDKEQK